MESGMLDCAVLLGKEFFSSGKLAMGLLKAAESNRGTKAGSAREGPPEGHLFEPSGDGRTVTLGAH